MAFKRVIVNLIAQPISPPHSLFVVFAITTIFVSESAQIEDSLFFLSAQIHFLWTVFFLISNEEYAQPVYLVLSLFPMCSLDKY